MNTTTQNINPDSCIQVMEAFWREQVETAETVDGTAAGAAGAADGRNLGCPSPRSPRFKIRTQASGLAEAP